MKFDMTWEIKNIGIEDDMFEKYAIFDRNTNEKIIEDYNEERLRHICRRHNRKFIDFMSGIMNNKEEFDEFLNDIMETTEHYTRLLEYNWYE